MSRSNLPSGRPPTHPGEMLLEEFLKPLGIPQTDFAERIGVSFVRLNAVINGRRGVTADTALRLERATGMDADLWLDLQMRWDLWHAMHSDAAAFAGWPCSVPFCGTRRASIATSTSSSSSPRTKRRSTAPSLSPIFWRVSWDTPWNS